MITNFVLFAVLSTNAVTTAIVLFYRDLFYYTVEIAFGSYIEVFFILTYDI